MTFMEKNSNCYFFCLKKVVQFILYPIVLLSCLLLLNCINVKNLEIHRVLLEKMNDKTICPN